MCHDDPFIDEQCMKKEKIGENTFIWLRKCKGSKVCAKLPYYGGITGSCIIKVRSHYDGESCANGNKCTSGNCDGTKCIGKDQGIQCEPGLGQCKKGLLCRKEKTDSSVQHVKIQFNLEKNVENMLLMVILSLVIIFFVVNI